MCAMVPIWNRDLFNRKQEIAANIMCFVIFHHWLVWSRLTVLSLSELLMFSYYNERNIFIYVLVIVLDTLNLAAVAVLYSGMVRSIQAVLCTADQPSALFHGVRFVRRRGAVCPCWKQQPSALAELQHWFFTYCRARQVYLLFSISILLFSDSKLMTSKVTSRGFFWLSNTCLSLFRCYKFHQIVFAWLEVWAD